MDYYFTVPKERFVYGSNLIRGSVLRSVGVREKIGEPFVFSFVLDMESLFTDISRWKAGGYSCVGSRSLVSGELFAFDKRPLAGRGQALFVDAGFE